MKPVFINFTDDEGKKTRTFTTCSLKTGMMDNIFDLAERADNLEKNGDIKIGEVKEFYADLKALILSVFKYQFNFEELNENIEQEELMRAFKALCNNLGGEVQKN